MEKESEVGTKTMLYQLPDGRWNVTTAQLEYEIFDKEDWDWARRYLIAETYWDKQQVSRSYYLMRNERSIARMKMIKWRREAAMRAQKLGQ